MCEKRMRKFNGVNFCCSKNVVLLKNIWADLHHMGLCVYWRNFVDKIKNPLSERNFIMLKI